jgi:hypothetical protein
MKKISILLLSIILMMGCAHNQMRFNLAPGSTEDDYNKARIECGDSPSGGYFLFGPLIILVPVVAVVESIKFSKRHGIQDCLEAKGFKCIENCAHVSQYLGREKQELERQKALDADREQLAAERRKVEAERQQMETLKLDHPEPSPLAMENAKPSVGADQRNRGIKGIVLMNGNVIEGQIINMNPDIVKIRTKEGEILSYDFKKEVQRFITE